MAGDVPSFLASLNTIQSAGPVWEMIKYLPDAVSKETPLLAYLKKFGMKPWDGGGDYIYWNVKNANISAKDFTAATDSLVTTKTENLKPLTMIRAKMVSNIVYDGDDLRRNQPTGSNPLKMADFVGAQIESMKNGFAETLELHLLGSGTTDAYGTSYNGDYHLFGMQYWNETTPSGGSVIAGQTRSSSTTWLNNQSLSVSSEAALTTSDLRRMVGRCRQKGSNPNLILMNENTYRAIWNKAKSETWFKTNQTATDLGFPDNIDLGGAAILPCKSMTATTDGGYLSADMKRVFVLTIGENGFTFYYDPDKNMKLEPVRQDPRAIEAYLQPMVFDGQLIDASPRTSGVIYWS